MKEFLKKIKSRKFLTCIAGVVTGLCMMFGLDEGAIDTIAGAIVSLGSICTYIYTEGKIDAAAVSGIKDTVDVVKDAIDEV
jgi:phage shock protein PspC (stress-responsive transcriptional regulator)